MVEGEDVALLKQFQNNLFPETSIPIDTIPATSVGGWGGWNQAVGSDILLKNAAGDGIVTYSIFDSDYHPIEAIRTRYSEAKQRGLSLHIWCRKELENYLLVASAIRRAINSQLSNANNGPALTEVEQELEDIAEELKQEVIDCVATHIQSADRKLTVATANQRAREIVSNRWKTHEDRMGVIPGKEAVARVSRWVQGKYKLSVSGLLIAHHMIAEEMSQELQGVLRAIEKCEAFPERKLAAPKKPE